MQDYVIMYSRDQLYCTVVHCHHYFMQVWTAARLYHFIPAHTQSVHVCNAVEEHHYTSSQTCSDIANAEQCDQLDRIVLFAFLHRQKEKWRIIIILLCCTNYIIYNILIGVCVLFNTRTTLRKSSIFTMTFGNLSSRRGLIKL